MQAISVKLHNVKLTHQNKSQSNVSNWVTFQISTEPTSPGSNRFQLGGSPDPLYKANRSAKQWFSPGYQVSQTLDYMYNALHHMQVTAITSLSMEQNIFVVIGMALTLQYVCLISFVKSFVIVPRGGRSFLSDFTVRPMPVNVTPRNADDNEVPQ